MTRVITATVVAVLTGSIANPASAQAPAAAVRAFHAALAAGDSSAALELLDANVVIYEGGGVEASRNEYRSHHLGADMTFAAATTREVVRQDHQMTGDVAWVLTEAVTTGTFRDREINSRGTETMILRRTPQGWRITHIHWSSRRRQGGR